MYPSLIGFDVIVKDSSGYNGQRVSKKELALQLLEQLKQRYNQATAWWVIDVALDDVLIEGGAAIGQKPPGYDPKRGLLSLLQ